MPPKHPKFANLGVSEMALRCPNNSIIINITITTKVRGEGRTEDKSSTLTGLNLIYPGLLVFYVEVFLQCSSGCKIQKLSSPEMITWANVCSVCQQTLMHCNTTTTNIVNKDCQQTLMHCNSGLRGRPQRLLPAAQQPDGKGGSRVDPGQVGSSGYCHFHFYGNHQPR